MFGFDQRVENVVRPALLVGERAAGVTTEVE